IRSLDLGDFNNDTIPDLLLTSEYAASLFLGDGDGTFSPDPAFAAPASIPYVDLMTAADYDGDGNMDIAVHGSGGGGDGIVILPGHGDGSFGPETHIVATRS